MFLSVGMSTETASEGVVKLYANPQGQMSSRITSTDYVGDVSWFVGDYAQGEG